jgi:hypothetical protein
MPNPEIAMSRILLFTLFLSLILCTAVPGLAQSLINNFTAQAQGESYVLVKWNSGAETGLTNFQVERSLDGISYSNLAILSPQGSNSSYSFEDHNIYQGSNRTYYYRLKAQMANSDPIYSSVQSVVMFFSGIQQTWGSIKALFR